MYLHACIQNRYTSIKKYSLTTLHNSYSSSTTYTIPKQRFTFFPKHVIQESINQRVNNEANDIYTSQKGQGHMRIIVESKPKVNNHHL